MITERTNAVIVRKNTDAQPEKLYQLYGAVYGAAAINRHVGTNFEVPLDKNRRSKTQRTMPPLRSSKSMFSVPPGQLFRGDYEDLATCGFPIHARCWDLLTLVLGPVAETRLDLQLQTMLERWTTKGKPFVECRTFREWALIPLDSHSQRFVVSKFPAYTIQCVPPAFDHSSEKAPTESPTDGLALRPQLPPHAKGRCRWISSG